MPARPGCQPRWVSPILTQTASLSGRVRPCSRPSGTSPIDRHSRPKRGLQQADVTDLRLEPQCSFRALADA